jgi:hypothetical protein
MNLDMFQLDIDDTTFLYTLINDDVHTRQPLGFADGFSKLCHLKRCLYGIKQSPSEFSTLVWDWLVEQGWTPCMPDPCIYTFRTWTIFAMIALYVDNIPLAYNDTP